MKVFLIVVIFFLIIGITQSKANNEKVGSANYSDCDHDCLACSHLDDDCEGDDFYQINMLIDMDEDEAEW